MLETYKPIGIFGGTFDPIHNGHIRVAQFLCEMLNFSQIQFIPCHYPPHRDSPSASAQHRLSMLSLAIKSDSRFSINTIELARSGPSYMIDTLKSLWQQFPQNALCLIIGIDVLANFNQWHHFEDILKVCHLIVVNRPNYDLNPENWLQQLIKSHQCFHASELAKHRSGYIFFQNIPPQSTSSSLIRQLLLEGGNISKDVPIAVKNYILEKGLYQSINHS